MTGLWQCGMRVMYSTTKNSSSNVTALRWWARNSQMYFSCITSDCWIQTNMPYTTSNWWGAPVCVVSFFFTKLLSQDTRGSNDTSIIRFLLQILVYLCCLLEISQIVSFTVSLQSCSPQCLEKVWSSTHFTELVLQYSLEVICCYDTSKFLS